MVKSQWPKWALILVILTGLGMTATAQDSGSGKKKDVSPEEEAPAPVAATLQQPVFPAANPDLIFVEGEDAVTTNFANEAILNYSCSGSRALQLNRLTGLQGGSPFYAEYAFYVEEAGEYELWYGGTPAGPQDDLFPAYSSPFHYVLDDEESVAVYREDINVGGQYTPSYYWNRISGVTLESGVHNLRFEVTEKRNHDGRFFFYLDAFFFVKMEGDRRVTGEPLPRVFPKNLEDRSMDFPFRAIEDYEIVVRDNPDDIGAYVQLSLIHTLVGDYLSALKHLKRASALDPDNMDLLVLQAKNLIWKGDVADGLEMYRKLLLRQPDRLDLWNEAGKVAAWTSRYEESVSFYEAGLQRFPESFDLMVNLGLTHLWAAQERKADEMFLEARRATEGAYDPLMELARAYGINGDPQRAADVYRDIIRGYPDHLEAYLELNQTLYDTGERRKAEQVREAIESSFIPSQELSRRLDLFFKRQSLTEETIATYQARLEEQPDDLELRGVLAQTFFWNGLRDRAIGEYLSIIANYGYRALTQMDQDALDLLHLLDQTVLLHNYLSRLSVPELKKEISAAQAELRSAATALEGFRKKVEAARSKGEELPVPEGEDPQDRLKAAEDNLSRIIARAQLFAENSDEVYADVLGELGALEGIRQTEAKEEEVFFGVTKASRWQWDREGMVAEMRRLAQEGQALASYVVGRIEQIEGHYPAARRAYEMTGETSLPAASVGVYQTFLWEARNDEATEAFARLGEPERKSYPYLSDLEAFIGQLEPEVGAVGTSGDISQADAVIARLEELEGKTEEQQTVLAEYVTIMQGLLRDRLRRTVYFLEESTYLMRRELGDFYMRQEDLDGAIRQYRQVLAVDPWDIGTVFRLGNVYQLNGDWSQAMKSYERVYWDDPLYETVSSRYNELARSHADSLTFSTETLTDSNRTEYSADAVYRTSFGSSVGLDVAYETDHIWLYSGDNRYRLHTVAAGVPIDLYRTDLLVTPRLGVQLRQEKELSNIEPAPTAGIDLHYTGLPYVAVNAAYRYMRYEETWTPGFDEVTTNGGDLGATVFFTFVQLNPFRDSSARTFGEIDVLSDGNIVYSASQELSLAVYRIPEPEITFTVVATAVFENSTDPTLQSQYYSANQVLTIDGGLRISSWIGLSENAVLGLTGRFSYGRQINEFDFSEGAPKMSGSLDAELGIGNSTITVGSEASETDEYWSVVLRLGFVARLPRLLAP